MLGEQRRLKILELLREEGSARVRDLSKTFSGHWIIDSKRARDVMNATLAKIAESQAKIFILDISGVGVVDTAVANHLIKISRATRLMGCECTISGVSAAIAQTIVELGIDVGIVKTTATMKDALADSFRRLGLEIAEAS